MQTALPAPTFSPSLVVSIHDVSTLNWERVEEMLIDLASEGAEVTSLLVIPDHHRKGRVDENPAFSSWLGEKIAGGHEVVLHGFYHLRPSKPGEGVFTRLITRSYTAGEGEFYDPSFEEALELLREGKQALGRIGVSPVGFIAPAWLLGSAAERAVREEGFAYTTRIATVIDCRGGKEHPARSMVYSVRSGWRRRVSLIWNEFLFRRLQKTKAPLLRLGLHPPDWDYSAIRSHVLQCVRKAVEGRRVTTYREWVAGTKDVSLDPSSSNGH